VGKKRSRLIRVLKAIRAPDEADTFSDSYFDPFLRFND